MYEESMGKNYHDVIRKILIVKPEQVPDSMIDADANIEAMKGFISPFLLKMEQRGKTEMTDSEFESLQKAARYYLAAILCIPLRGRFKTKKNFARWEKKRVKCMNKATAEMYRLMDWVRPDKKQANKN